MKPTHLDIRKNCLESHCDLTLLFHPFTSSLTDIYEICSYSTILDLHSNNKTQPTWSPQASLLFDEVENTSLEYVHIDEAPCAKSICLSFIS